MATVTFEHVTKRFGDVTAVDDLSLTIGDGEFMVLVGPSGCGKTTSLKMVNRLIEPTAGQVFFDGRDISELTNSELKPFRRDMQIIFQDPFSSLDPRTPIGDMLPLYLDRVEETRPAAGARLDVGRVDRRRVKPHAHLARVVELHRQRVLLGVVEHVEAGRGAQADAGVRRQPGSPRRTATASPGTRRHRRHV